MDSNKVITATFSLIQPVYLFEDGFESGDTTAWSGVSGYPAVQTAIKHDGTYAMQTTVSGRTCYLNVDETTVNMRAYLYVATSAGNAQLMRFRAVLRL